MLTGGLQASVVHWGGVWQAALRCEGRRCLTRNSSVGRVLLDSIQALGSGRAAALLEPHWLPGSMVACAVCSVVRRGMELSVAR